jgi:hypothetical protein
MQLQPLLILHARHGGKDQKVWPVFTCCILLRVIQNNIFVSVNTTIQVKVITKVIYININHNMFRPLLGHHQVYLCT